MQICKYKYVSLLKIVYYFFMQEFIAGPSGIQNDQKEHPNYMNCTNSKSESALTEQQDEVLRLISQVKEILCDCGEGFIQVKIHPCINLVQLI